MIYFDNAATGGYKPNQVIDSVVSTLKFLNANAGRSGHKLSVLAAEKVFKTRKFLSECLGCRSLERVVFTLNCTDALNKAIFGLCDQNSHIVTTVTEHNSVLRPLYELQKKGADVTFIKPKGSFVTADDVKENIDESTDLVIVNAVSNVTGTENDIDGIGTLLKDKKTVFMVDGAQLCGHKKVDMERQNIDVLCMAGHKGLYAIQGVGVIAFREKAKISPTVFGGTGIDTFSETMPDGYPERLEAGTLALPAILSLNAGAEYAKNNAAYIQTQLTSLTEFLISNLSLRPFIKLYSIPNRYGIVAFSHTEIPSQELTQILSDKYGIAVRGGFHCAPLMHKFLGSEKFGLLRVSFSINNTRREVSSLLNAIDEISLTL